MNEWDGRADYYRASRSHASGDDLEQVVTWCEPAPGVVALDVATGGGHVARRLRELGCLVTTCDAAAGMEPDVVCPAGDLPFDDGTFDVVACRLAVHHFPDPQKALGEMARVTRRLLVVEDTLLIDGLVHEAESLRDVTHVRQYAREEFVEMLAAAGLAVRAVAVFPKRHQMDDWLSATGCAGETATRVRALLAHVAEPDGSAWSDQKIVLQAARG